jgi:hypothetical protein
LIWRNAASRKWPTLEPVAVATATVSASPGGHHEFSCRTNLPLLRRRFLAVVRRYFRILGARQAANRRTTAAVTGTNNHLREVADALSSTNTDFCNVY